MAYSYSQLEALPTDKPFTKALTGRLGIYLRCYPGGRRVWVWRGTLKGETIWTQLGDFDKNAHTLKWLKGEASRCQECVDRGVHPDYIPEPEVKPEVPTVQEAWEEYVDVYLSQVAETYKDGQLKLWPLHIQPVVGPWPIQPKPPLPPVPLTVKPLPLDKLNTSHVDMILDKALKEGHLTTSNRLRSQISKFWNWCFRRWPDLLDGRSNPVKGRKKAEELPLERVLSEEEVRKFGAAWKKSEVKQKAAILWILLVGSRSTILTVWKSEWNGRQIALIPRKYAGAKNARHLVMGKTAVKLVQQFDHPIKEGALTSGIQSIREAAGLEDVTPRILRKTWSSLAVDWGEMPEVIDFLQNHKGSRIKQAYQQRALEPYLPVVQRVEDKMLKLLGIKPQSIGR